MSEPQYRCPRCQMAAPWTDGTVQALGDERDEYWCQYCGEETPLADCEQLTLGNDETEQEPSA